MTKARCKQCRIVYQFGRGWTFKRLRALGAKGSCPRCGGPLTATTELCKEPREAWRAYNGPSNNQLETIQRPCEWCDQPNGTKVYRIVYNGTTRKKTLCTTCADTIGLKPQPRKDTPKQKS